MYVKFQLWGHELSALKHARKFKFSMCVTVKVKNTIYEYFHA